MIKKTDVGREMMKRIKGAEGRKVKEEMVLRWLFKYQSCLLMCICLSSVRPSQRSNGQVNFNPQEVCGWTHLRSTATTVI